MWGFTPPPLAFENTQAEVDGSCGKVYVRLSCSIGKSMLMIRAVCTRVTLFS